MKKKMIAVMAAAAMMSICWLTVLVGMTASLEMGELSKPTMR